MRSPRHSYNRTVVPASEPVTLDDVKAWARIDTGDDDALITDLIVGVRQSVEEYLRRSLITQTWKLTMDIASNGLSDQLGEGTYNLPVTALYGSLPSTIELPKGPVQSVTSVTTYDLSNISSVLAASNYSVDTAGGRLTLNSGSIWPANMRQRVAVEILYVTGYGLAASAVPMAILTAIKIWVATLYEQRGLCDASDMPPQVRQLLNQFRIMGSRL